jgi:hypothetical protein
MSRPARSPARPGAQWARRTGALAGAVAVLVAAVAVQGAYPSYEERYRPIASTGEANQRVRTRDFDVRVEKTDVARTIMGESDDGKPAELGTDGVFVIVTATVTARRETIELAGAYLRTEDGSRTLVSDTVKVPAVDVVGAGTLDAGGAAASIFTAIRPLQPRRLALIFEIPAGRVAGARLWLSVGRMEWRGDRQAEDWFRPQARVDLGISPGRAAALLAAAPRRYQLEKQCWAPPNC